METSSCEWKSPGAMNSTVPVLPFSRVTISSQAPSCLTASCLASTYHHGFPGMFYSLISPQFSSIYRIKALRNGIPVSISRLISSHLTLLHPTKSPYPMLDSIASLNTSFTFLPLHLSTLCSLFLECPSPSFPNGKFLVLF